MNYHDSHVAMTEQDFVEQLRGMTPEQLDRLIDLMAERGLLPVRPVRGKCPGGLQEQP